MQMDYSNEPKGQWESLLRGSENDPQASANPKWTSVTVVNEEDPDDPPPSRGGNTETAEPVGDTTLEPAPTATSPKVVSENQCMPSQIPQRLVGTPVKQEKTLASVSRPATLKHPPATKTAGVHRGTHK